MLQLATVRAREVGVRPTHRSSQRRLEQDAEDALHRHLPLHLQSLQDMALLLLLHHLLPLLLHHLPRLLHHLPLHRHLPPLLHHLPMQCKLTSA